MGFGHTGENMNRRGFIGSILAAAAAPAIVRADSLMRIVPVETEVLVPMTLSMRRALPSPTITGVTVLNAQEWSVDGEVWYATHGPSVEIPAGVLRDGSILRVRSFVAKHANEKTLRLVFKS
jgi:hypothetical protein